MSARAPTTTSTESSVIGLADGGFAVVWTDWSGTGGDTSESAIRMQRYDSDGNAVGGEILVNTTTEGEQEVPVISSLANGNFVVVWRDFSQSDDDASGFAVRAQVFDSAGIKVGGEFLVNTTTFDEQDLPDVAGLSGGGFVVAWDDLSTTGGDTDDWAVRAQIFDDPPEDDPPEIVSNGGGATATIGFDENGTGPVTTVEATDNDSVPVYGIAGGADAGLFNINASTGVLSFKSAPDFENPADSNGDNSYQVTVKASDGVSDDIQALTINVGNVAGLTLNGTKKNDALTGSGEEDVLNGGKEKGHAFGSGRR